MPSAGEARPSRENENVLKTSCAARRSGKAWSLLGRRGRRVLGGLWLSGARLVLLAGREIAIAWNERHRSRQEVSRLVLSDFAKILAGLLVSVALALLLPKLL